MQITVEQVQAKVLVTLLRPQGNLDAATFNDLIDRGSALVRAGAKDLLLDLSQVPHMSSAGLVALHSLALLLRGEAPVDPEMGWEAMKAIRRDVDRGVQKHFKLLNPSPRVDHVLELSGFKALVEIFTDQSQAVESFSAG
jgi:anti-anti-sigma regulatory factor